MCVKHMSVDQMCVKHMSVDQMCVKHMSVDQMSVGPMVFGPKTCNQLKLDETSASEP